MNPLELFRAGHDYIAIAAYFSTTEPVIEKVIHKLRHAERMTDRQAAAQIKHELMRSLEKKARDARIRAELAEIRARRA
ncbi:hypothetical protein [Neorhizobium sp. S3-V5DH]|uniref:hypothetical protein n=1 Tax=Neorhizobium sp. S3-V5DH TaxID=2485166 RepID=UPI00104B081C|nr:hypothetical protein [Neorhizobium sp. S3-V5DH]TCV66303.1 hypothetical protein EDE09_11654 [Neorhizobium sp. S3-V5DH]